MHQIIRQIPMWMCSILILTACEQKKVVRNNRKAAAINQKREDSYKNNRDASLLLGNVKMTTNYIYDNEAKDTTGSVYDIRETYFYDRSGNCTERLIYSDGKFESRDLYEYDEKNHQIADYNYAEDGTLQFTMFRKFDNQGNLTETGQNGAISFKTNYEYDEWGTVTKEVSDKEGQTDMVFENSYDDEGILKEQLVKIDANKVGKYVYRFDNAGNRIEFTQRTLDNTALFSERKKYNVKGLITKQVQESADKPAKETSNIFDQYGNVIKQFSQNVGETPYLKYFVQHTYDDKGNWIKKISTKYPTEGKSTMLRYLEYYEE